MTKKKYAEVNKNNEANQTNEIQAQEEKKPGIFKRIGSAAKGGAGKLKNAVVENKGKIKTVGAIGLGVAAGVGAMILKDKFGGSAAQPDAVDGSYEEPQETYHESVEAETFEETDGYTDEN